ncbi:MAG: hypothetical protein ACRD2L_19685, partial [Terriglobia bacterium]
VSTQLQIVRPGVFSTNRIGCVGYKIMILRPVLFTSLVREKYGDEILPHHSWPIGIEPVQIT